MFKVSLFMGPTSETHSCGTVADAEAGGVSADGGAGGGAAHEPAAAPGPLRQPAIGAAGGRPIPGAPARAQSVALPIRSVRSTPRG